MFESSGFMICLGITLILSALIMYYCKKRLEEFDHKLLSMTNLINALTEEINKPYELEPQDLESLKPELTKSFDGSLNAMNNENIGKSIYINPYSDTHNTVVNSHLGTPTMESDSDSESDDSDSESGSGPSNHSESPSDAQLLTFETLDSPILSEKPNTHIKVVEIPIDNTLVTNNLTLDEDDSGNSNQTVNYNNMFVAELRKLVSEKKLSTNTSKLKKQELIDLLSNATI